MVITGMKETHATGVRRKRPIYEVGRRILERLRSKKWSQAQLAREVTAAGYPRTPQWVQEVIGRKYLSGPTVRILALVLNVESDWLTPEDDL